MSKESDELKSELARLLEKKRQAIAPRIEDAIAKHLDVLNNLEPNLGCAKCGRKLEPFPRKDARPFWFCSRCQGIGGEGGTWSYRPIEWEKKYGS